MNRLDFDDVMIRSSAMGDYYLAEEVDAEIAALTQRVKDLETISTMQERGIAAQGRLVEELQARIKDLELKVIPTSISKIASLQDRIKELEAEIRLWEGSYDGMLIHCQEINTDRIRLETLNAKYREALKED